MNRPLSMKKDGIQTRKRKPKGKGFSGMTNGHVNISQRSAQMCKYLFAPKISF